MIQLQRGCTSGVDMKKILLGYLLFFAVLFALFFGNRTDILRTDTYYKFRGDSGARYVAMVQDKQFMLYSPAEGWQELYLAGINMGAAKPGTYPGDFGISKEDYLRWFQYISDMNANTIRVYLTQAPAFYEALDEFNDAAEKPLYLIQGVYLNENHIAQYQDAYGGGALILNSFLQDIRRGVDAIHGNAVIETERGDTNSYRVDVSRFVIGWILGIEWELEFVETTNQNNAGLTGYDGDYVYAEDVTPFEVFLAEAADTAISYEMQQYGEQRPLAMSNWVTSDPLEHPGEPNPAVEDAIAVDMENLKAKEGFEAGFFASYHVYPYYPDLFNYALEYQQDDPVNTYRAYLRDLNAHHTMPVLISELGIPSARGIAHENIHSGFNQGHVTETEQGEILVSLMQDIRAEGMMGSIVFSWQDEWFKRTWNTQFFDLPDRRPFWMDYQTNEQSFGILAFDPGNEQSVCYVDGDVSEWSADDVVVTGMGDSLSMRSDEKFLYLMIETDRFGSEALYVPIDTIPGQGNTTYNSTALGMGADFLLRLDGAENSALLVDPYYNVTYHEFAVRGHNLERDTALEQTDTGVFVPITLMLNREITVPGTGEVIPPRTVDTGRLRYGIANPGLPGYDSIADFYYQDGYVEVRLPWLLLNVSDPSSKKIVGDMYKYDGFVPIDVGDISVGLLADGAARAAVGNFSWDAWEQPTYHERLKESYPILQTYFKSIEAAARAPRTGFERFWARWNQTQFSNIGFWFPIQPILNYGIAFLLSVIVYFFLALLYIHGMSALRTRHVERIERRLREAQAGMLPIRFSRRLGRNTVPGMRNPLTRSNLLIFSRVLEAADTPAQLERVRDIMFALEYDTYICQQLRTRDTRYLVLLIRLIGALRMHRMSDRIVELIYQHQGDTDLEYQGLLTLSVLGDFKNLVRIAMDKDFTQRLSFRSLQEVFKAFHGDNRWLYSALMDSPDPFIRRIAIKRIGFEGYTELADLLLPYLDAPNYNVVIDAVRALGQLGSSAAADRIAELLGDAHWEVRAVTVKALANIDAERYERDLVKALCDPEWQVRHNAAEALCRSPRAEQILKTAAEVDRYAYDALKYAMDLRDMQEATL